jgi:hypothetical protein
MQVKVCGWMTVVLACLVGPVIAAETSVRFLRLDEVAETLQLQFGATPSPAEFRDSAAWDAWIRALDSQVRARVDQGVEDSISNFVLYGSSFTALPRVPSVEEAEDANGELIPATKARIRALRDALAGGDKNERVAFVRQFLTRKKITTDAAESYFAANLRRFVGEQRAYQQKLKDAEDSGNADSVYQTRGTLFESRGLSADTSLLPNFALEETLRSMVHKRVLAPKSMHRIAVIGPGLDFTDKRDGYDFYPLQTLQPFAVLETVAKLGLGDAKHVEVVCLDLNAAVTAHVATIAAAGRAKRPYTIQLPRDTNADWSTAGVEYWQGFGALIAAPVKPLPVPAAYSGLQTRAVSIPAEYTAQLRGYDLNVVTQTIDLPAGQGFDLVIATNVLVYYDRLQQALAMANIARMMNSGAVFLANNVLPAQHTTSLEYLGRKSVTYSRTGVYGDDVVVYRRR